MKKKKSSVGCLFWIALILLIFVVFLFSRTRIEKVMETTGFMNLFTKEPGQEQVDVQRIVEDQPEQKPEEKQPVIDVTEKEPEKSPEIKIEVPEQEPADQEPVAEKNLRNSILYFVSVDDENKINLKAITRPVYYDNSPLTDTLNALITGLTSSELNKGLISLIPENTVIHGITVSNMTATINFNEALSFNQFGREGLEAELKQIVYTATEFPTVDRVQILVNGQKREFLSTEGVFIGEPLTRSSVN